MLPLDQALAFWQGMEEGDQQARQLKTVGDIVNHYQDARHRHDATEQAYYRELASQVYSNACADIDHVSNRELKTIFATLVPIASGADIETNTAAVGKAVTDPLFNFGKIAAGAISKAADKLDNLIPASLDVLHHPGDILKHTANALADTADAAANIAINTLDQPHQLAAQTTGFLQMRNA